MAVLTPTIPKLTISSARSLSSVCGEHNDKVVENTAKDVNKEYVSTQWIASVPNASLFSNDSVLIQISVKDAAPFATTSAVFIEVLPKHSVLKAFDTERFDQFKDVDATFSTFEAESHY
ncbi:hypothetical protein EDD11_003039 [Mortierella claussenii]|nr:hypothetical protein EDD11_003039 [Mortierella claussenii]